MTYLMVRTTVEDFGKWKKAFDSHSAERRDAGSLEARVLRGKENPDEVVVVTRWASVEAARRFMSSADLKANMIKAGVSGKLDQILLDEVEFQPH